MEKKRPLVDWIKRWFFIKEPRPRAVIGIAAILLGLAISLRADYRPHADGTFSTAAHYLGGLVSLPIALAFALIACVSYNLYQKMSRKGE